MGALSGRWGKKKECPCESVEASPQVPWGTEMRGPRGAVGGGDGGRRGAVGVRPFSASALVLFGGRSFIFVGLPWAIAGYLAAYLVSVH